MIKVRWYVTLSTTWLILCSYAGQPKCPLRLGVSDKCLEILQQLLSWKSQLVTILPTTLKGDSKVAIKARNDAFVGEALSRAGFDVTCSLHCVQRWPGRQLPPVVPVPIWHRSLNWLEHGDTVYVVACVISMCFIFYFLIKYFAPWLCALGKTSLPVLALLFVWDEANTLSSAVRAICVQWSLSHFQPVSSNKELMTNNFETDT